MSAGDVLLTQARSQLSRQESAVDTMRTRTTAVFSASGVVAALFGPKILTATNPTQWGYLAVAFLFVGAIATGYVLAPRNMTFTEKLDDWWDWLKRAEDADDRDEALSIGLAENLDALWKLNRDTTEDLGWGYLVLCIVFGLQVAAWAIAALVV